MKDLILKAIAVIGIIVAYCAVSTTDYYLIELVAVPPAYTDYMMYIGGAMILPALIFCKGE